MTYNNLLLEIGVEEIPSRFLPDAMALLEKTAKEDFDAARITFKKMSVYATPRRIALIVGEVEELRRDIVNTYKGPAWSSAFDMNGNATRAAYGFAKSKGVTVESLIPVEADGTKYAYAEVSEPGMPVLDVLPELLPALIRKLVFPKSMYWDAPSVRFARPVRWIVAMVDKEIIPFQYGNVKSGSVTSGHRFMGAKSIQVDDAADFMELLYDNHVILDQEKRRQKMIAGIAALERQLEGSVEMDPETIEENLYLVEYPVPFFGGFNKKFLEIPEEVLTTSMKKNQKYFSVRSANGKLLPHFVGVSNNLASNMEVVREGNERVLRARLEDAVFFWAEDLKKPLAANLESLKSIVYQEKLGTLYDKVMATRSLALWLCEEMGMNESLQLLDRAALLAKTDLVTGMVCEFPDLQGVMGREYAIKNGEPERVAKALYEQYLPRAAGGEMPTDTIGALLGLSERVHIIVSCFKVGLEPTGSQDPYALRRAARCINEILWGKELDVDLLRLVDKSCELLSVPEEVREKILIFLQQRLHVQIREKGYSHELTTLALSVAGNRPLQSLKFLEVFSRIQDESWFIDLITSAVRVRNILSKSGDVPSSVDSSLFQKEAEGRLHGEIGRISPKVDEALSSQDWKTLATYLSELSPCVSTFFDDVLVMDPDERVKSNRLSLLMLCNALFLKVGDLGVLKRG